MLRVGQVALRVCTMRPGVVYVSSRVVRSEMLFLNDATDISRPNPDASTCRFNCRLDRFGKPPMDWMRRETHAAVVVVLAVRRVGERPQSPHVVVLFKGLRNDLPFATTFARPPFTETCAL